MGQISSLPPLPTGDQLRAEYLGKWEEILDVEEELVKALTRMIEAKRQIIREVKDKHAQP